MELPSRWTKRIVLGGLVTVVTSAFLLGAALTLFLVDDRRPAGSERLADAAPTADMAPAATAPVAPVAQGSEAGSAPRAAQGGAAPSSIESANVKTAGTAAGTGAGKADAQPQIDKSHGSDAQALAAPAGSRAAEPTARSATGPAPPPPAAEAAPAPPSGPQPSAAASAAALGPAASAAGPGSSPAASAAAAPDAVPISADAALALRALGPDAFHIQVGSFRDAANAQKLAGQLEGLSVSSRIDKVTGAGGQVWSVVLAGPYPDAGTAAAVASRIRDRFDLRPLIRTDGARP